LAAVAGTTQKRAITGYITASDGTPIQGVLVIASGESFYGWTDSHADGSFKLSAAGAFVSFRHADFQPLLLRSSDFMDPVHVEMERAGETVRRLKRCSQTTGTHRSWPGGGLRVEVGKFKGRINGEHDSHWYVRHGRNWLHVVDGYLWHTGLPRESILVGSESITVRGWVFDDIVGIDLSRRSNDGKYWRWVGAPVSAAMEYGGVNRETADYFDAIIETACVGSP
jgi:hypothetical protein